MVFILSEVGLPKDYTRPTSSGKQFYRNKFTLTYGVAVDLISYAPTNAKITFSNIAQDATSIVVLKFQCTFDQGSFDVEMRNISIKR